jgi:hypothetical protein
LNPTENVFEYREVQRRFQGNSRLFLEPREGIDRDAHLGIYGTSGIRDIRGFANFGGPAIVE